MSSLDSTSRPSSAVWRDRFTNPGDWVFALSGDFDIDEATDLVRRYFGTLNGAAPTEDVQGFPG